MRRFLRIAVNMLSVLSLVLAVGGHQLQAGGVCIAGAFLAAGGARGVCATSPVDHDRIVDWI